MNNLSVSIIIPVYNGLDFTKKCLSCLIRLKSDDSIVDNCFNIVVVDDGSKDGTSDWIKETHPEVHLVHGDGNLWWSGGINKGIAFALDELISDYILWWNNDILPANDYLVNLYRIIKSNPRDVMIGSKIFILNKGLIWGMGGRFDPKNGTFLMYGSKQPDNETYKKPFETDWFPGMGTTMHRSVFEKVGFLDEKNFPQYHGDSDFTFRAKKAGFRLIAFPDLVIHNDDTNTGLDHKGSFRNLCQSLTTIKSNYNIKKDLQFFRKHTTALKAYLQLFNKYFRYIGGFFKWKVLAVIGIKKSK